MTRNVRSKLLGACMLVLGAFAASTAGDIKLSWRPNQITDAVTSYSAYRSVDSGIEIDTFWSGITDTFCRDSTVGIDVEYTYWITAWNRWGESPRSNYVYGYQSSSDVSPWTGTSNVGIALEDGAMVRIDWAVEASDRSVLQMWDAEGDTFITLVEYLSSGPYELEIGPIDNQSEVQLRVVAWLGPRMTIYAPQTLQIPTVPEAPEVEIWPFR